MSDYSEYTSATSTDALAELSRLAEEQAAAEAEVARIEAVLEAARKSLLTISERLIPEKMDELGLSEFTTTTGLKIKIKENIRASIPKERQGEAFGWLREHGFAALIKRAVTVEFGKGEDAAAAALVDRLSKEELAVADKASVHPSTLTSFIKGQLEEGVDLPLEVFGVHRQRTAIIG